MPHGSPKPMPPAEPVVMVTLTKAEIARILALLPPPSHEMLYPPGISRVMKKLEEALRHMARS